MADDAVTLRFPGETERVRLARILVATLGDDVGFDFDEVDDLRIAVDELCFVLIDLCSVGGSIELVGQSTANEIVVEGTCRADAGTTEFPELSELTRQILATVVDDYEVGIEGDAARFRFTKRKS